MVSWEDLGVANFIITIFIIVIPETPGNIFMMLGTLKTFHIIIMQVTSWILRVKEAE